MNKFINSDLAVEKKGIYVSEGGGDACYTEEEKGAATVCRLRIEDEESEKKYGRKKGHYVTVFCDKIWLMDNAEMDNMAAVVSGELEEMLLGATGGRPVRKLSVLVAGLGNTEITADAIGPFSVQQMTVTRHLRPFYTKIFGEREVTDVSAILPGVLSQTGIETVEIVKSAVKSISPDVVIAIDALAARSCERLGTTVQLSDNGISPGSGIGNMRKAINRENLGVPVIALGVPTVVDSSTLVYDTLERAGVKNIDGELQRILEDGRGFFVSPKESDMITRSVSELLSLTLDMTFGTRV